jgi:hypothetical protein
MLTENQAQGIVQMSIQKIKSKSKSSEPGDTLDKLGFTDKDQIQNLLVTIVSDPEAGVPRLHHYLDVNGLADLDSQTTVAALTTKVKDLSAGALVT